MSLPAPWTVKTPVLASKLADPAGVGDPTSVSVHGEGTGPGVAALVAATPPSAPTRVASATTVRNLRRQRNPVSRLVRSPAFLRAPSTGRRSPLSAPRRASRRTHWRWLRINAGRATRELPRLTPVVCRRRDSLPRHLKPTLHLRM